ncbi:MAG TPA: prepilin-type N-terminal cleavage/methylation domain-containing protein [Mycobacteriales bacterium]|nr:prepilin-type N-terminal cleavage/methylation domain-containing protein [Mycobacteriales bacterium]
MQRGDRDEGMTLIEIVIAMAIVTVGLLGMLSEVVSYIKEQSTQRAHATALRCATTTLEDARATSAGAHVPGPVHCTTSNGISYTTTTKLTPETDPSVSRLVVTVNWTDGHGPHQISLNSATTDTSARALSSDTGSLITNATGTNGATVTVGSLSLSPSSVSVDSSGTPGSDVTATLAIVGVSQGTSVALTWTDDNGAHQTSMTSSDGKTWSATVSKSMITRKVTAGSKTVVFSATIPGVNAPVTASLTAVPQPDFNGSCSVLANPIVTLLRKTTLPEVITCNTVGLSSSDHMQATYASGSSTATATLSSSDGSTWTATLPAGTSMAATGSTESFTFTLTRQSDGYTKSQSSSVALA